MNRCRIAHGAMMLQRAVWCKESSRATLADYATAIDMWLGECEYVLLRTLPVELVQGESSPSAKWDNRRRDARRDTITKA